VGPQKSPTSGIDLSTSSVVVEALHQPAWPDESYARSVYERLKSEPAIVPWAESHALLEELARVNAGDAFVVMGGDCAELFDDTTPGRVVEKARHLHQVADVITTATGVATTRIGRFAGQFAKPRSQSHERLPDGRVLLTYRGDAVNGLGDTQRNPDPDRMLTAYHVARDAVHAINGWDGKRYLQALQRRLPGPPRTYVSHEALLLGYEQALVRHEGRHASSAHFLWVGDRTRHPEQAHVAFAAGIGNPVGIKLGPSVTPSDVRRLARIVHPEQSSLSGRTSLIVRMGSDRCATVLPQVVDALGRRAAEFTWVLDPMHGNGRTNIHGQKTRLLTDLRHEIATFFTVLGRRGLWPGGIHLETTPDDVTECVPDVRDLSAWLPEHRSACDPRLNPEQALDIADLVAGLMLRQP
jgi:3-deoxy-7-phosphoheptulonate synthase